MGNEWSNILPKSSQMRIKPPPQPSDAGQIENLWDRNNWRRGSELSEEPSFESSLPGGGGAGGATITFPTEKISPLGEV